MESLKRLGKWYILINGFVFALAILVTLFRHYAA